MRCRSPAEVEQIALAERIGSDFGRKEIMNRR